MAEDKKTGRKFIRVDTRLEAFYKYVRLNKEETGKGSIVDLSGGGLRMVVDERIKEKTPIMIATNFTDGPIEIKGVIVSNDLVWYVEDYGKKPRWTAGVCFEKLTAQERSRIINFVHRLSADIREAKLKK